MPISNLRPLRRTAISLLVLTLLSMTTPPVMAQIAAEQRYDVAGGSLATVLNRFARASHISLSVNADLTRRQHSKGVRGIHRPDQALAIILQGTGLSVRSDARGGFIIERAPTVAATLPSSARHSEPPVAARRGRPERPQPRADDIVVTAARTILPANALPLTVDVIGSEDLTTQVAIGGSTVDAVSALVPSFSPTRQKLTGNGETLRGRSPLYAINGIPQTSPIRDGSRDGYNIDPFFLDRVELIYGSNALQGIGATGGIVNQVVVEAPKRDGVSGRVLVQGTADDGFKGDSLGAKLAGLISYRAGIFDATVGAALEKRGAFRDGKGRRIGVDNTQGEIQDSDSWSLFGRFGVQLGDTTRLDLIANRYELNGNGNFVVVAGDRTTGIPTSSMRGEIEGETTSNRYETLSLSLTDTDLFSGDLIAQVYFNRSREIFGGDRSSTYQDINLGPAGTVFDQSANRSRKIGARVSYERAIPGIPGLSSTIGLDLLADRTEQSLIQTGRVWVPPTDFRSIAPFAQANLALFDNVVRLAGGVRYEDVRLKVDDFVTLASYGSRSVKGGAPSFHDALFNGGAVVEPVTGIRFYASYAEGYTVPDVGRILRSIRVDGVDIANYLDLKPVVSNNREIGVEIKRGPLNASATYFWSSSKLGQLLVPVSGIQLYEVERQRVEIKGLELNATVKTPLPGLDVSIGYAHLSGRSDSDGDDVVDIDLDGANIAPDRLNLAAIYKKGQLSARLQGQFYLSRRFEGSDVRNDFGGYTLADAAIRYDTNFGGISLSAQNLFNKQYITYSSDTGYPTDNVRFFAGRGRTLTLGWDYRF